MNANDIAIWIDTAPQTQKDVFFAVCCRSDKTMKKVAVQKSLNLLRKMAKKASAPSVDAYLDYISVSDLVRFFDHARFAMRRTLKYKLFNKLFGLSWVRLFIYLYDLTITADVDEQTCWDMGDGLLLAGLFLYLKPQ